jgi:hypothetical protein
MYRSGFTSLIAAMLIIILVGAGHAQTPPAPTPVSTSAVASTPGFEIRPAVFTRTLFLAPATARRAPALFRPTRSHVLSSGGAGPEGGPIEDQGAPYRTAIGYQALFHTVSNYNTASGYQALFSNKGGAANTASGWGALSGNTEGSYNTALGSEADSLAAQGQFNLFLGAGAMGEPTDTHTIRIGLPFGPIPSPFPSEEFMVGQNRVFIAGIAESPLSAGTVVGIQPDCR